MARNRKQALRAALIAFLTVAIVGSWLLAAGASGTKWSDYAETQWYDNFQLNDTYTIDSAAKLAGIAKLVNEGSVNGFSGKILKIAANIDLSAHEWVPIGTEEHPFRGTLYTPVGESYIITGLVIEDASAYAGLVGNAQDATIGGFSIGAGSRITLGSDSGTSALYVGSVVGRSGGNGTVYDLNSTVSISVYGNAQNLYVGGLAGFAEGTVSSSGYNGAINAEVQRVAAGGLVGYGGSSGLKIKRVTNTAAIAAESNAYSGSAIAGGIIGQSTGQLLMEEDSTPIGNSGGITVISEGVSYAGGIVGKADSLVTFSGDTSNSGAVAIQSPLGELSAAGGLVGAITSELGNHPVNIHFAGSGNIVNNGGSNVYTGGIAGRLETSLIWERDLQVGVDVFVSGASNVHTGGLIGFAGQQVQFLDSAHHTGSVTVERSSGSELNEAYTGGLIGFSDDRILLDSKAGGTYSSSGSISVTGDKGLYTGGIAGNRAFARTSGKANNVASTGNIDVSGSSLLYTGGYVGVVPADAADFGLYGLAYAGKVTVAAESSNNDEMVATGGIVGYYAKAEGDDALLADLSFSGQLYALGGGAFTYTGGIAGYVEKGDIQNASAGANAEEHALIESDGKLGGVAGFLNGSVDVAKVANATLVARTPNSDIGGVAAIASGTLAGARVGDPLGEDAASILIKVYLDNDGEDNLTAGGVVGRNEGSLVVKDSSIGGGSLLAEERRSGYTLGGIVGAATAEAILGEPERPLEAKKLFIKGAASNSLLGGAVGRNGAVELYLTTEAVSIEAAGDELAAGGVIGLNEARNGVETTALKALRTSIEASGASIEAGGIAGRNTGRLVNAASTEGVITLTGPSNSGGGIAGLNHGDIEDSSAVDLTLNGDVDGASLGGIAGVSRPLAADAPRPSITSSTVVSTETLLGTITQPNVRLGGIVGLSADTDIVDPVVKADNSDYVILTVKAPDSYAGGIVGESAGGSIKGAGNTTLPNMQQLFITTSTAAANARAGGIAGHADKTAIKGITGKSVNLNLAGSDTMAGGVAGHFQASDSAVISGIYMDMVSVKAVETAANSRLGGAIGLNDSRASDAGANPASASSTLQHTRIIGNLSNSNSPVVENRASNAIIGGLLGENRSLVANTSIIDKIVVSSRGNGSIVGGYAGVNRADGTLYYTYANANLFVQGQDVAVGGHTGLNEGQIMSSYVDIDVKSQASGTSSKAVPLGGLVGINKGLIDKSYAVSAVSSTGAYSVTGGLVGDQLAGTIRYSYAGKQVAASGASSFAGGFAGRIGGGEIKESYSAANVTSSGGALSGGFAGRYDNSSRALLYKTYYIKDDAVAINKDLPDFAAGEFNWLNAPGRLSTLLDETLRNRDVFPGLSGWDFNTIWRYGSLNAKYLYPELIRTANSGGGDGGTEVNASVNWYTRNIDALTFQITSEAELAGLASLVNGTVLGVERQDFAGRTIRLMNPVHIQSDDWISIGAGEATPFEGTFNGGGHLIDGLSVESGQDMSGLFGVIGEGATIEKVYLEPVSITGDGYAGSLAAINHGVITNVKVDLPDTFAIKGNIVGGFIGANTGTLEAVTLLFPQGASVEAVGRDAIAGAIVGDNSIDIKPELFSQLELLGTVRSSTQGAVLGGYIGQQAGDFSGFDITIDHSVAAEGQDSIAGGIIGRHLSGATENLNVLLGGGSIKAPADGTTAGAVTGVSASGNKLRNISLQGNPAAEPIIGGGILGGIVGQKTGMSSSQYDAEELSATGLLLTAPEEAASATMGGLFGKLVNGAANGLYAEGDIVPHASQGIVGGIAGEVRDSLLNNVESLVHISYEGVKGEAAIGGIAGVLAAADHDQAFDLGGSLPYYSGLYRGVAKGITLKAVGSGNSADIAVGGLVGKLDASVYFSEADADLSAAGALVAAMGGLAGESRGIIVQSESFGVLNASNNTEQYTGGAVGYGEGGGIYYTYVTSGGKALKVQEPVTRLPQMPVAYAGGFIGLGNGVNMQGVSTDMPVTVTSDSKEDSVYAGGFAGAFGESSAAGTGSLKDGYAKGKVEVQAKSVVIAGGFAASINRYNVVDAYASGNVSITGFDTRTGGFAGAVERLAAVSNVYAGQQSLKATGVASATRAYIGGFAGYNDGAISGVYANAADIALSAAGASAYKGSLLGYQYREGSISDSQYAASLAPTGHDLGLSRQLEQKDRLAELALDTWQLRIDAGFLLNNGESEYLVQTPYQLFATALIGSEDTALDFYRLFNRAATEAPNAVIKLGADINLTNMRWKPYVNFRGEFDGANYAIKGLKVAASSGAQGFITTNYGSVVRLVLDNASVSTGSAGNDAAGLVAGINSASGIIADVQVKGASSGGNAGGIAGINDGAIEKANVHAEVKGSLLAGGIAGRNNGQLHLSSSSGTVAAPTAGGIAGENGDNGELNQVFSYGQIAASDPASANGGGLAGYSSGIITRSYFSGSVEATGSGFARAGGIAGHAAGGAISEVFNAGDVQASDNGIIARGRTFFGGIAGQKEAEASIQGGLYNKQMLKADTAYYNEAGVRVAGNADGQARGLSGRALTGNVLPEGLQADFWQSKAGFYPQLKAFGGSARSLISAAALTFDEPANVYSTIQSFTLSSSSDIPWTAAGASLRTFGTTITGTATTATGRISATAASASEPSKTIVIRKTAPIYEQTALPAVFAQAEATFKTSQRVDLTTEEQGGVIYYTLNGTTPVPGASSTMLYSGPLELRTTTTVTAIVTAVDKEASAPVKRTWKLEPGITLGGGGFIPEPEPKAEVTMTIGNREIPLDGKEPVKAAINSIVSLNVPSDVQVYYTVDGSEPTTASLRYNGEIWVTGNMTIKFITSKDKEVRTVNYVVRPAEFAIRSDAAQVRYMDASSTGKFRPDEAISRYELVTALSNLLSFEQAPIGSMFADVSAKSSATVAKFASSGIVQGYPDGAFKGDKGLTRAELVVILSRVLRLEAGTTASAAPSFTDTSKHWSASYVEAFVRAGYVKGYPDGTFRPSKLVTRAEAVVLLNNIMGTATDANGNADIKDVSQRHWAYQQILAATK